MNKLPKILVIAGPTASGKSTLAIQLAQKFDGEIISADSRQIYRGMDLGTGKVERDSSSVERGAHSMKREAWSVEHESTPKSNELEAKSYKLKNGSYLSAGIVHHGIDIINPDQDFNVADFKKYALEKIPEILQRKKLPIICGGTGFWIQAITDNLDFPQVKPDLDLRKNLDRKNTRQLFAQLQKIDPQRAAAIDSKNKVRLIRALEICQKLGKVPRPENNKLKTKSYEFLQLALDVPKEVLREKIQKRLDERFEQGMLQEVQNLHQSGISWQRLESFGLEYRRLAEFLQDKISESKMQEKLFFDIIHYAKRQMTWLKKNPDLIWIPDPNEAEKLVEKFLED